MHSSERRGRQRILKNIPVTISGESPVGTFIEDTDTLVISTHGAFISLSAQVSHGQVLLLKNCVTLEERTCRVVYIAPSLEGKRNLGVEFCGEAPRFWNIDFPSTD